MLSAPKQGPQLPCFTVTGCILQILGTFSNGRVESWMDMRPLKPKEMCEEGNAACIARRLASFHAADIQNISKEPQVFQRIFTWYSKNP